MVDSMTVFSFPYLEGKAKDGTSVFRPWVRIHLQGADDNWSAFQLYADAGADITLLRPTDCQILGYQLETGKIRLMSGVCSGLIRTFIQFPVRQTAILVDNSRLIRGTSRLFLQKLMNRFFSWILCSRLIIGDELICL